MKAKIITRERSAWRTGVAVLVLATGCAEAPQVGDEAARMEHAAEAKEARRDDAAAVSAATRTAEEQQGETALEVAQKEEEEGDELVVVAAVATNTGNLADPPSDAESDTTSDSSNEPVTDNEPVDSRGEAEPDLVTCSNVSIRSREDVDKHRMCAEVVGDMQVSSVGLTSITAEDFPLLTSITGDLVISGLQTAADQPFLESVTLGNLRFVKGGVLVVGAAVPEFGGSGPLQELHLPALEQVGGHDALGLAVFQASLKVLDLPALTKVEGAVLLDTLFDLCTVNADKVERIGGELIIRYLPRVPVAQLEAVRSAVEGRATERLLGCCAASTDDQVACDGFTERAQALYCTGC